MILLKKRLCGKLVTHLRYVRGYEDKEEFCENIVYLDYLLFGKIPIYRQTIFVEDVPLWAVIKRSTLGFSEWSSKWPAIINASADKRVIKTIRLF
jgi:hypothetical protein